MGIKSLSTLLRRCNFERVHLSKYRSKKIAIDISPFLFKYRIIFQDEWLQSFVNLVCCLRRNDIHAIFIYDGIAPTEKQYEKECRRKKRDDIKTRACDLQTALDKYEETGKADPILLKVGRIHLLEQECGIIDKQAIIASIDKCKKQTVSITHDDKIATKNLLEKLGVPHVKAPGEAEKFASELFKAGLVDAVLSDDTDVLMYGVTMISKIDTKTETVLEIEQSDLLKQLDLSSESFKHLCITLGTDYNTNIKGIGPIKALNLIKKYGTIDEIAKNTNNDVSCLNHKKVLDLFTLNDVSDFQVPLCKEPDLDALASLGIYNIDGIKRDLCKMYISRRAFLD